MNPRIRFPFVVAVALALGAAACQPAPVVQAPPPLEAAVYAEHSDSMKKVQPGWNVRIFNRSEVQQGTSISFNKDTGVVTLAPGRYHITGSSTVTYDNLDPKPAAGWNTESRPNAGYCRLRYVKDAGAANEKAIAIGTISNANIVPSMIETYLEVTERVEIVLEHQVGDTVNGIYLQDNSGKSSWHVFARIAIRKM